MPKTSNLNHLKDVAKLLEEQAGRVCHHITSRRVNHTVRSLLHLIDIITKIQSRLQNDKEFYKRLEFVLYQSQIGPTEMRIMNKDIFIQGTFKIDMLRQFFVINEPEGMITISVEGTNVKIKKEFDQWTTAEKMAEEGLDASPYL